MLQNKLPFVNLMHALGENIFYQFVFIWIVYELEGIENHYNRKK